jgi:hypothetical protein
MIPADPTLRPRNIIAYDNKPSRFACLFDLDLGARNNKSIKTRETVRDALTFFCYNLVI